MATGFKIWIAFFHKLYRFVRYQNLGRCLLRKPERSFRLMMRFAIAAVDPERPWLHRESRRTFKHLSKTWTRDGWSAGGGIVETR